MEVVLSEETPLIFQWLPKKFGSTVPNNEDYPYLQRLVNWAEREPQREIYLFVRGSLLSQEQIKELEETLHPCNNVKVVDFPGEVNLGTLKIDKESTLAQRFESNYPDKFKDGFKDISEDLPFANRLDFERLLILQYRKRFTGKPEAIYMDFDILPSEEGKKIGPVDMPGFILVADGKKGTTYACNQLENSIIAVNESSEEFLSEIITQSIERLHHPCFTAEPGNQAIFSNMMDTLRNEIRKVNKTSNSKLDIKSYLFSGNIKITNDNSWQNAKSVPTPQSMDKQASKLYSKPELPIKFSKSSTKHTTTSDSAIHYLASFSADSENLSCTPGNGSSTAYSGLTQPWPGNIPKA